MKLLVNVFIISCLQVSALTCCAQRLTQQTQTNNTTVTIPPRSLNQQSYQYFADQETGIMVKLLTLSQKQHMVIAMLNRTYYQHAAAIIQDRINPGTRKFRIEALKESRNTQLKKILQPAQYQLFENAMAQAKARADEKTKRLNEAEMARVLARHKQPILTK